MSPLRRHGGGRPRSAHSILDLAEQWGISEKTARRLAALDLNKEALAIMVRDSKCYAEAQRGARARRGRYMGGMKALGMRSRIPANHNPAPTSMQ